MAIYKGTTPIGGNVIVSGEYSTEEQIVGTWIDGRPVYRKVLVNHSLNRNYSQKTDGGRYTYNVITIDEASALFPNLDRVINSSGVVYISTTNDEQVMPIGITTSDPFNSIQATVNMFYKYGNVVYMISHYLNNIVTGYEIIVDYIKNE